MWLAQDRPSSVDEGEQSPDESILSMAIKALFWSAGSHLSCREVAFAAGRCNAFRMRGYSFHHSSLSETGFSPAADLGALPRTPRKSMICTTDPAAW